MNILLTNVQTIVRSTELNPKITAVNSSLTALKTLQKRSRSLMLRVLLMMSPLSLAEEVDTEIVILVDVSGSTRDVNFDVVKQSYANSFRSAEVQQAIQKGGNKSIAVSVVYWASRNRQYTAVEWMKVYDSASANQLADAIMASVKPFGGRTALGSAIDFAAAHFGHETGGSANGFESMYQVVNISGDGIDNATPPRRRDRALNVAEARDNAMAAGVDMIDGVPWEVTEEGLDQYFRDHVIAGEVRGRMADTVAVTDTDNINSALTNQLVKEIELATVDATPEPSSTLLLLSGCGVLIFRRKRK